MEKIVYLDEVYLMEEQVADASADQATTQDATATEQATSEQTATEQATTSVSWVKLASKSYSVNVEVPTCGIKVSNYSIELLKNGSTPISSGATIYTTDYLVAKLSYTVAPAGSNCAGYGMVKLEVKVDGTVKASPQKNYTELRSSKSDSISYNIGSLSEGSHSIVLTAYYANSNVG